MECSRREKQFRQFFFRVIFVSNGSHRVNPITPVYHSSDKKGEIAIYLWYIGGYTSERILTVFKLSLSLDSALPLAVYDSSREKLRKRYRSFQYIQSSFAWPKLGAIGNIQKIYQNMIWCTMKQALKTVKQQMSTYFFKGENLLRKIKQFLVDPL